MTFLLDLLTKKSLTATATQQIRNAFKSSVQVSSCITYGQQPTRRRESSVSSSSSSSTGSVISDDNNSNENKTNVNSSKSLRQRLINNEKLHGTMLMSDSTIIAELLSYIGYDYIIIDHEHSPTDVRSGQLLLQAIDSAALTQVTTTTTTNASPNSHVGTTITQPIVRVPSSNDPTYIKKVLDSMKLPSGILIPMIDNVDTAISIIQSIHYPPTSCTSKYSNNSTTTTTNDGVYRGTAVPFIRSNQYGIGTNATTEQYTEKCYDDLLVMIQIESIQGIEAIPDIIKNVPRIDAIFIGPYDLSASIGKMGQFHDVEVQELILYAEQMILNSNKVSSTSSRTTNVKLAGFCCPPYRTIESMFKQHQYNLVCTSVDIGLLRTAAMTDYRIGQKAKK